MKPNICVKEKHPFEKIVFKELVKDNPRYILLCSNCGHNMGMVCPFERKGIEISDEKDLEENKE